MKITLALLNFIKKQARFWVSLIYEMHLCDMNAQLLAPLVLPFLFNQRAPIDTIDDICKIMGIGAYNHHRQQRDDGLVISSGKHEKLHQLVFVTRAVDHLMQCDVRLYLRQAMLEDVAEQVKTVVKRMAVLLYKSILPLAVAALWLWKSHERHLKRYEQDTFLIQHLWLNILKIRSLIGGMTMAHRQLTIQHFDSIIPATSAIIRPDIPLSEFTMMELWLSIRQMAWNTSNLMTGKKTHLYADILWFRLAELASMVGDIQTYNHPSACEPQAQNSMLLRVNSQLLADTERIFYHYYEMTWLHAWFTIPSAVGESNARHEAAEQPIEEGVWLAMVNEMLVEGVGEFVRLDYEKRVWWYNSQWDDIENYRFQSRTNESEPRRAIMKLYRDRFDIISSAASMMLNILWIPASDSGRQARDLWRNPEHRENGLRWKSLWDIAAHHDQHKQQQEDSFPYRTEVNEDGVRFFYKKGTNRRLRGVDAETVNLMFSQVHAIASKSEYDAIQEAVLNVIFNKNKTEYEARMGVGCIEVASWPFVKDVRRENIALSHLCSSHTPTQSITSKTPFLFRIFNDYILYDGTHCVSQTPFLANALQDYVYSVEYVIRIELHAFAVTCRHAPKQANDEIVMKIRRLIMYVPPILRACFRMQRDIMTGLEVDEQYVFPNAPVCHWNEAHLKTCAIWPLLMEGAMTLTPGQWGRDTSILDWQ